MTTWQETPFADLLEETRDGEWGEGSERVGHQLCEVIRGTDFASLNDAKKELPLRWIPDHLVARKQLRRGDLLLETAGGTAKQSTGRSAILRQSFFATHCEHPILCSSFARHLRLRNEYSPEFLYYLLQALYRAGYMAVFNLQHTGVSRFQFTAFKNKTTANVPDQPTQKKIAAILSAYDDLIENNRRRIALLEKMAEEIYREWFVRLRFPGHEQAKFEKGLPVGWRRQSLSKLGTFLNGYAFDPSEWFAEGLPIIKIKELNGGVSVDTPRNNGDSIPQRYLIRNGDIVFSWSGSLVVRIWDQGLGLLNQHLFKVAPAASVPNSFLYLSIKFSIPVFEGLTTGATMQHIKRKELDFVKVIVPPDPILEAFATQADSLLSQSLHLRSATQELQKTRDALLPRLISGKLAVDDLDIRLPASMQLE